MFSTVDFLCERRNSESPSYCLYPRRWLRNSSYFKATMMSILILLFFHRRDGMMSASMVHRKSPLQIWIHWPIQAWFFTITMWLHSALHPALPWWPASILSTQVTMILKDKINFYHQLSSYDQKWKTIDFYSLQLAWSLVPNAMAISKLMDFFSEKL